ncbi:hypothetical protein [Paraburkholderia sp. BL6665CI2N2]|uniref:hypothetical protein n=1 Tax=Paraburkholderia sp. BL6665CI2N2 TaxID=1938806 RepID=UPI00106598EE|nr:hypothetical protein [Paraburkholderia sp. BL6665CI2N2]
MESTFTIGFLNDLIFITATADQNFSAIDQGVTFPYISTQPVGGPHFGAARRTARGGQNGRGAGVRHGVRAAVHN